MFKKKFKKMASSKNLGNLNFELITDNQASSVIGGCGALQRCGTFTGSCDSLTHCNKFTEKGKIIEDLEEQIQP